MMNAERDTSDRSGGRFRFPRRSTIHSYLELMRLPNVFTAMADVAMGFLFVQSAPWNPTLWDCGALVMLMAASSLLYVAGVVLNDVFDLEADQRRRPERPLPSGRISLSVASRLGWRMLAIGVLLGAGVGVFVGHMRPGIVAALLAASILLYDAWLKPTFLGPLAMGGCRMLNVLLGMNAADVSLQAEHWLVAGGIGVYVAGVTWFARRESGQSSRLHLALATAVMVLGIALLAWFPDWSDRTNPRVQLDPQHWRLLVGILGALILWRCIWAVIDPASAWVRMAVAQCVLSIVMLDALACYAIQDVFWAGMILTLLLPALFFGHWIETT